MNENKQEIQDGVSTPAARGGLQQGQPAADIAAREPTDNVLNEFDVRTRQVERIALIAFGVFWLLWSAGLGVLWSTHPQLEHGDPYSDANALNAGRSFDLHGLGFNLGLPQPFSLSDPPLDRRPYFTYPPGPDWLHQISKMAGLRELWQWRLLSVCVTSAAALLAMVVMSALARSWVIGALGAFFYMVNAAYTGYADNLRYVTYAQLALFGVFGAWILFERSAGRARWRWAVGLALAFFVSCWLTLVNIVVVCVFAGLRALMPPRRFKFAGVALLVAVAVFVSVVRYVHAAAALGSFGEVSKLLRDKANTRSGASADDDESAGKRLTRTWFERLGGDPENASFHDREFQFPALAQPVLICGAALALLTLRLRGANAAAARAGLCGAAVLIVSGLAWFVLMRQHALIHRNLVMYLMPGLALLMGTLAGAPLLPGKKSRWLFAVRIVGTVGALAMMGTFAYQLRTSVALNQIVNADKATHEIVERRRAIGASLAQARAQLVDVPRIWIDGLRPDLAYVLDRPFEQRQGAKFDDVAPSELLVLEAWSDAQRERALRAFDRFGFPQLRSITPELMLTFSGGGTPGQVLNLRADDVCTLKRTLIAPALDRDSWTVQLELVGDFAEQRSEQTILICEAVDPAGAQVARLERRASWSLHDDQHALMWFLLPFDELAAGGTLRFQIWSRAYGRFLSFAANETTLPAGFAITADGRMLEYTLSPQAAGEVTNGR